MKAAALLLFAALLLGTAAALRAPEYDEAYSMFLTAGHARPDWPAGPFTAGQVRGLYAGRAGLGQIAENLRAGDVHPPLYFWALEGWRHLAGPGWLSARLLSVAFGVAALAALGWLAALAEVKVAPAMALALLSYGFAYTAIVARGFALAQFCNVLGVALLVAALRDGRRRLALAAGLALGAAGFTNYLAVFIGAAALAWAAWRRWRLAWPALAGFALFLPADAWFFLAQRGTRAAQFVAFSAPHALALLLRDSGAAWFGGLPLYAGRFGAIVAALLGAVLAAGALCAWRHPGRHGGLFALCAAALPAGLLALGLLFNNTPIEIRYLAFSTPFLALLLAGALPRPALGLMLAVQSCGIAGLILAPATMQPQALAARAAWAAGGTQALILVPFGNDGVGVPGPFIAALPAAARVQILRDGTAPDLSAALVLALARLSVDQKSRAQTAAALSFLQANPCLTKTAETPLLALFSNRCAHQQP